MEESINMIIDDHKRDFKGIENQLHEVYQEKEELRKDSSTHESDVEFEDGLEEVDVCTKEKRITKVHSTDDIIGDPNAKVKTRKQIENIISHLCFTSKIKPPKVIEALKGLD